MIISKQNLLVVHTTKVDSAIPALDNVHIAEDGSTVGVGGKMLLAVSPVDGKIKEKLANILDEEGEGGITISSETAKGILKRFGTADKKFDGILDHCNIEKIGGTDCRVTQTDGKRKDRFTGKVYRREFVPYKNVIRPAMVSVTGESDSKKIVLNLKRLLLLLQTIEKIAPDSSGDSPVWIEFTDNDYIVIRGINMINGQRALGIMSSYTGVEGKWLEPNEWERSLCEDDSNEDKDESHVIDRVVKHKKTLKTKTKKKLFIKRK